MTEARMAGDMRRKIARTAAAFVEQALLSIAQEDGFDQSVDCLLDALRALETEGSHDLPRLECAET